MASLALHLKSNKFLLRTTPNLTFSHLFSSSTSQNPSNGEITQDSDSQSTQTSSTSSPSLSSLLSDLKAIPKQYKFEHDVKTENLPHSMKVVEKGKKIKEKELSSQNPSNGEIITQDSDSRSTQIPSPHRPYLPCLLCDLQAILKQSDFERGVKTENLPHSMKVVEKGKEIKEEELSSPEKLKKKLNLRPKKEGWSHPVIGAGNVKTKNLPWKMEDEDEDEDEEGGDQGEGVLEKGKEIKEKELSSPEKLKKKLNLRPKKEGGSHPVIGTGSLMEDEDWLKEMDMLFQADDQGEGVVEKGKEMKEELSSP